MGDDESLTPDPHDPMGPPAIPTLVHCIHCNEEYESYRIEWRVSTYPDGTKHGFWCCPIPGCDGAGFTIDIWPVDPEYRDENGELLCWFDDDSDEEDYDEEGGEFEAGGDKPPKPPDGGNYEDDIPF